ncbi:hypothetical protein ABPG74_002634 [Tetrahymena malaccensis]
MDSKNREAQQNQGQSPNFLCTIYESLDNFFYRNFIIQPVPYISFGDRSGLFGGLSFIQRNSILQIMMQIRIYDKDFHPTIIYILSNTIIFRYLKFGRISILIPPQRKQQIIVIKFYDYFYLDVNNKEDFVVYEIEKCFGNLKYFIIC